MERVAHHLRLDPKLRLGTGLRLSTLLDLSETECLELVREIEADPLFQRLCIPDAQGLRIVRRKPFPGTAPAWRSLPLDEAGLPDPCPDGLSDLWETHAVAVRLLSKLGRERFERYFLHDDQERAPQELGSLCGLEVAEVLAVRGFLDSYLLRASQAANPDGPGAPGWALLAEVELGPRGLEVFFLSPNEARGPYVIDYDRLQSFRRDPPLSPRELGRLRELLRKLELLNARRTTLERLLNEMLRVQKAYLESEGAVPLAPLTQREMAARLGLSPSAICRTLKGRGLRTPWGKVTPLSDLFPSRRKVVSCKVRDLVREVPSLSDEGLRALLHERCGVSISRRMVNYHRHHP